MTAYFNIQITLRQDKNGSNVYSEMDSTHTTYAEAVEALKENVMDAIDGANNFTIDTTYFTNEEGMKTVCTSSKEETKKLYKEIDERYGDNAYDVIVYSQKGNDLVLTYFYKIEELLINI